MTDAPRTYRGAVFARVALFAFALLFSACETPPPKSFVKEEMQKEADNQLDDFKVPAAVRDAMFRGGSHTDTSSQPQRFDVSVVNLPAKTFFLSLVADAGVNVVVDPEIEGTITLELSQVTVDDVLKIARDVYGYEYRHQNNIYTILPRVLRTEVFPINYIDIKREGSTQTTVVIGEVTSDNESGSNGSNRNSSRNSGPNGEESALSGAAIKTSHQTDFWKTLELTLKAIVGSEDGKAVVVNPQAGLVVVKALPKELNDVRDFLERSELSVKRQVVLETKILEIRLNDGYETGINWNLIQGSLGYDFSWSSDSPATGPSTSSASRGVSSTINIVDITKFVSLLESQGNVQVLSSPRVSTVNNQKALIRVGVDEFFVTGVRSTQVTSAANTNVTPEINFTSFFSGISLDVTPQIAENGDVILHIHPIVSDVQDQQKTFTVDGNEFSLPLALRDIRESDSIVRARSGQVVVLGGLMKESSENRRGKRPILGDIPGLNVFFKTKSDVKRKSELVILMRPIVASDSSWGNILDESAIRFNSLGE